VEPTKNSNHLNPSPQLTIYQCLTHWTRSHKCLPWAPKVRKDTPNFVGPLSQVTAKVIANGQRVFKALRKIGIPCLPGIPLYPGFPSTPIPASLINYRKSHEDPRVILVVPSLNGRSLDWRVRGLDSKPNNFSKFQNSTSQHFSLILKAKG